MVWGALVFFVPLAPVVEPIPDSPDVVVRDRVWEAPSETSGPGGTTSPGKPEQGGEAAETEPFYCRPEAPFPQDDCIPRPEPTEEQPGPEVTPGDVEREVRRIGLPRLAVTVQPPGATLVNLDTIFHTRAPGFERSVTILDHTVDLRAAPTAYTWHHGDGSSQTTAGAGRAYPHADVVHRYRAPGLVRPSVDVSYRVSYRVDGGAWTDLEATITAPGPATGLRVREARPVLSE